MYLDKLLCLLNDKLKAANQNYSGGRYFGLAYPVVRDNKQTFPTILESEPVYIGADDAYPITVYHRITGKIIYSKERFKVQTATVPITMVVFGVRGKLNQTAQEVEAQIISLFPDRFLKTEITPYPGITGISFSNVSSNLMPTEVFAQEYKGVDYNITSEYIYFSVSYTLSIDFQKDCLELCEALNIPHTLCEFITSSTATQINDCLTDFQRTVLEEMICESGGSCEYDIYFNGVLKGSITATNCENININLT